MNKKPSTPSQQRPTGSSNSSIAMDGVNPPPTYAKPPAPPAPPPKKP